MANTNNKTKVITGINTRLSYFHGWEPVSINGGAEKYSVSVLIPKDDKATVDAVNAAIDAAIEEGIAKFGGKKPNKAAIKLPLRDGDVERDDEAYKGHYFINANSNTAPQIVDRTVKPILDRGEVYSGCYARVSLNFYAFNSKDQNKIDEIAEAIMTLRETRQSILTEAAMKKDVQDRIEDLATFLDEQVEAVTEYSDALVRRLIERITVYDEKLIVEFKSGLEVEVEA